VRAAVASLVLAVGVTAAGCSGSSPEVAPTPTPSPTPVASGRFASADDLGVAISAAARDAGSARGTIEASSPDGSVSGQVAYAFDDDVEVAAEVRVSGPINADLGVVLSDDVVYLRVPGVYRFFVSAPWVRVPTDQDGDVESLVESLAAEVPGEWLTELDDPDDELSYLGAEDVDGVELEGYRIATVVDGEDVARTYWIGEDDLLRRLESMASTPGAAGESVSQHTYFDWGEPVVVSVPDPADVADLPAGLL